MGGNDARADLGETRGLEAQFWSAVRVAKLLALPYWLCSVLDQSIEVQLSESSARECYERAKGCEPEFQSVRESRS